MRWLFYLPFVVWVAGCTTPPTYDANAIESSARVTAKVVVGAREQKTDGPVYGAVPIGSVAVPIIGAGTRTAILVYEYSIIDSERKITKVRSEAPFFEVGQCVKLMTSNAPTYPRLAYGSECVEF